MDNRAIGVFDSGLGGLTATEELTGLLPNERIIYLSDSYNFPYGEKSRERIIDLSRRDLRFLLDHDVKAVFVACGTATSNALTSLREESPVPVFGVVEPVVCEAVKLTRNKKIGLLATTASVGAGTFQKLLREKSREIDIVAKACPKFASMVEEGIFDKGDVRVLRAVEEYLPPLKRAEVDTVILGCTHYPLLEEVISEYMGEGVRFISAGAAAARSLCTYLREKGLTNESGGAAAEYYTTGSPEHFAATSALMLRRDISPLMRGIGPL
ncbi:MAG: glutamate racemase [Oscillospiraceae bacterium]|nr:glutamate racemase [Oscillospiraceae bacterium]